MAYQALYRTYRPKRFSEVVGQEHVLRTLINSVKQDRIGHAYLFSGPRGTGKTTVARLLARVINCERPADGEPCGECDRCHGAEEGLGVLEIDAASHGSVDDMRHLVAQVSQVPLSGGMMVYIIDEVHMLSKEAFNAFLKTLEEPPAHAVFVLATTEPGKLLPTIHSRCQHFAFRRIPIDIIAAHIGKICKSENVPAEENALRLIARAGDGSVRDSISVLEQAIAYEPDGLTLKGVRIVLGIPDRIDIRTLGGNIIACNTAEISTSYAKLIGSGREPISILTELLAHFRDLLFVSLGIGHEDLELLPPEELEIIGHQAEGLSPDSIHKAIAALAKCEGEMKYEDEAALILEVSLLRLATKFVRQTQKAQTASRVEADTNISDESDTHDFPDAAPHSDDQADIVEPSSPAGGKQFKRMRRRGTEPSETHEAEVSSKPEVRDPKSVSASMPEPGKISEPDEFTLLNIPKDIDPLWKNALESVREASIAEYILLALATPFPTPSDMPASSADSPLQTQITLKYPSGLGMVVRLLNQPTPLNRLVTRLEEVLERPVDLRVAQVRDKTGSQDTDSASGLGMVDGEGRVVGTDARNGPSLFPGAGREPPTDPDLKKIHNLIVQDFPDYTIEEGANPS